MPFGKTLRVFSKKDDKRSSWGQNTEVAGEPSSTPSTLSQTDAGKDQLNKGDDVGDSSSPNTVTDTEEKILPNLGGAEVANEPPIDEKHEEEAQDDIVYPTGVKLAIISVALCLSVFLVALDNTIIATAIPRITDQFHALDDIGWYGSAYLLTTCAFQLFFGKLYTFFSIKWVYLAAIAIFELGSLICGVAPTSIALIIGRAVAGVGSAGIFSGSLIIIAYTVPLVKRPIYQGLIGAMYGIASVAGIFHDSLIPKFKNNVELGPLMGGAFTDKLTWRWCFYINLPIGAVTFIVITLFFNSPTRKKEASIGFKERFKQFDPYGTAIFVPAIICLLLALQWGGSTYAFSDGRIIALFVIFGLLVIAFIGIQLWKQETATVPPRIISQRSVAFGSWFAFSLGGAFFAIVYYIPIWFQAIQGVSAVESGIRNLPMILGVVVMSIASGAGITLLGYFTPFIIFSSILMAIGAGLLSTFRVDTGSGQWIGYQIIAGCGVGLGIQTPVIAIQTVLRLEDVPVGTSLILFTQTLGGAIFVSVAQNIFTNKLISGIIARVPNIDPQFILATGATSLRTAVSSTDLPAVLLAYNAALDQVFYIAVAMATLSIVGALGMEWKSVKGKKVDAMAAA
ncbi:hypothetical protein MMC34_000461 [Xylographa carneopallida]|nr:hypothetical protein [Xylographa carneopallida]